MTIQFDDRNGVIQLSTVREVQMSPGNVAFYKGVAASSEIMEELAQDADLKTAPFHAQLAWYWLQVGVRLAREVEGSSIGGQEQQELFIRGASLRKPEQRGFTLHIDTKDPWFGDPEAEDYAETAGPKLRNRLLEIAEFVKDGDLVSDQKITVPAGNDGRRIIGTFSWID